MRTSQKGQGQDQYGLAVYATWSLSYAKLGLPARTFLQISSLLHHEGISEEIFKRAASSQEELNDSELQRDITRVLELLGKEGSQWKTLVFRAVISELQSYSLIEFDRCQAPKMFRVKLSSNCTSYFVAEILLLKLSSHTI